MKPGDLVKLASLFFTPEPVGIVLVVEEVRIVPEGGPTIVFKYVTVLWPEWAVGRPASQLLQRIHKHHNLELKRVGDETR